MIINNVTLPDIDIADLKTAENYENAMELIKNGTQYTQTDSRADIIRKCCKGIFEAFDLIWGNGTAKNVFGSKTNLTVCLKAVDEFIEQVNELEEKNIKLINSISDKYPNAHHHHTSKGKKPNYYNKPKSRK